MAKSPVENDRDAKAKPSGAAHPYYGLLKCLSVAEVVNDLGGSRAEVPKSVLAHQLQMDEASGTFAQTMASVRAFGMVDGRGAYVLTDAAKQYFFPTSENEKRNSLLKMIHCPEIYGTLIDRFDGGRVPGPDILGNILHREFSVSDSWRPRVASLFLNSLKDADVIDAKGFLRFSSALHAASGSALAKRVQPEDPINSTEIEDESSSSQEGNSRLSSLIALFEQKLTEIEKRPLSLGLPATRSDGVNAWSFTLANGIVKVETSSDLSFELWEKLYQYVQVLKPHRRDPTLFDMEQK